jgi:hypothetical protein
MYLNNFFDMGTSLNTKYYRLEKKKPNKQKNNYTTDVIDRVSEMNVFFLLGTISLHLHFNWF